MVLKMTFLTYEFPSVPSNQSILSGVFERSSELSPLVATFVSSPCGPGPAGHQAVIRAAGNCKVILGFY